MEILNSSFDIKNITFINLTDYLEKELINSGKVLLGILENILTELKKLWCARFCELNYSDKYFKHVIYKKIIDKILVEKNIKRIIFYGPNNYIFENNQISIYESFYSKFLNLIKFYIVKNKFKLIWLNNFIKYLVVFSVNLFIKKKNLTPKKLIIMTSGFPDYWIKKKKQYFYRYLGNNQEVYKDSYLLTSILNYNSSNLRSYFLLFKNFFKRKNKNFIVLETYTKINELYYNFFKNKIIFNEKLFLKSQLSKLKIKYLDEIIINEMSWVDLPKQNQLINNTNNFFKNSNNLFTNALIPIYELGDGRCFTYSANKYKINTIGIQHGSQGKWANWRFIFSLKILFNLNSLHKINKILVDGVFLKKEYEKYNYNNIQIIGAPRIRKIPVNFNKLMQSKSNLFILLDLHNWYSFTNIIIKDIKNILNYKLIIRPHPLIKEIFLKKYKKFFLDNKNISIDLTSDLNSSLEFYKPKYLIMGDSGVAVELTLARWPIILLRSKLLPINSPIYHDESFVKVIQSLEEIKKIKTDIPYSDKLFDLGSTLIQDIGNKADNNLIKSLF